MAGDVTDTEPAIDSFLEALGATDVAGLPVGYELGHFRIEQILGRGGMGVVHRAIDVNLERPVALKLMSSGEPSEEARSRFLREARLAAALSHPNLLVVYEVGAVREGLFISMELVDGENLRARIDRGPLSLDRALSIARSVADALVHAHSRGVVHRDLKPENILLSRQDVPKVADFGIAKALNSDVAGPTRKGAVLGTIGYMAPEQAEGATITDRTDVWSFGVLVYEMLTGRLPFAWRTPAQLLMMLDGARPPSVRSLRRDVPRELDAVIARCLSPRADDRPSMREVASLLVPRRASRTPWVLGAAALAAVAIVVAIPRRHEEPVTPTPQAPSASPIVVAPSAQPTATVSPIITATPAPTPVVVHSAKPIVLIQPQTLPSPAAVASPLPTIEPAPSPSPHRKKPGVAETPPF
jgi:serine/threonine protein kinase